MLVAAGGAVTGVVDLTVAGPPGQVVRLGLPVGVQRDAGVQRGRQRVDLERGAGLAPRRRHANEAALGRKAAP